jgi:hypothetical protein
MVTTPTLPSDATASGATAMGRAIDVAPPSTRPWLRLEGVAAFAAGVAIFGATGGPWLLLIPLLLLPDLSMVGYLRDPRLGALMYNLVHNWAIGIVVLGLGVWSGQAGVTIAGAILIAHVGMDRAMGYGLKLPTSFHDTHLGRIGKARSDS